MRMKRSLIAYMATAALALTCLWSCGESDGAEEEFADWQATNEQYFSSLYSKRRSAISNGDGAWKIITQWSMNDSIATDAADHIIVEVLETGTGSGCPMYTDSVKVHYEGRLIPSKTYTSGYVFDKSFSGEYNPDTSLPSKMAVSGVVDGFATALQNMHIGDRWRVYIPYQLGYGTTTSNSIPAYSTLIFDITLAAYYKAGTKVPASRAAQRGEWVTE